MFLSQAEPHTRAGSEYLQHTQPHRMFAFIGLGGGSNSSHLRTSTDVPRKNFKNVLVVDGTIPPHDFSLIARSTSAVRQGCLGQCREGRTVVVACTTVTTTDTSTHTHTHTHTATTRLQHDDALAHILPTGIRELLPRSSPINVALWPIRPEDRAVGHITPQKEWGRKTYH